jgi:hypothetical protein
LGLGEGEVDGVAEAERSALIVGALGLLIAEGRSCLVEVLLLAAFIPRC